MDVTSADITVFLVFGRALVLPGTPITCLFAQTKRVTPLTCTQWNVLCLLNPSDVLDTLAYAILFIGLNRLGVSDTALHWVALYVRGRSQLVFIDRVKSNPLDLQFGVSCSLSVLGPKLFTAYAILIGKIVRCYNLDIHLQLCSRHSADICAFQNVILDLTASLDSRECLRSDRQVKTQRVSSSRLACHSLDSTVWF